MNTIAGIDYGSKLAGTTVIAWQDTPDAIQLVASAKKQDADQLILDWAQAHRPQYIFIDAPLSLPGVYSAPDRYSDYFYRAGDRELHAMSPMFLGGLTARAMQLKNALHEIGITVLEVYPARLADALALDRSHYKKAMAHIPDISAKVLAAWPGAVPQVPNLPTWHHVDALLALLSGCRYVQNQHQSYGDPAEGVIIV